MSTDTTERPSERNKPVTAEQADATEEDKGAVTGAQAQPPSAAREERLKETAADKATGSKPKAKRKRTTDATNVDESTKESAQGKPNVTGEPASSSSGKTEDATSDSDRSVGGVWRSKSEDVDDQETETRHASTKTPEPQGSDAKTKTAGSDTLRTSGTSSAASSSATPAAGSDTEAPGARPAAATRRDSPKSRSTSPEPKPPVPVRVVGRTGTFVALIQTALLLLIAVILFLVLVLLSHVEDALGKTGAVVKADLEAENSQVLGQGQDEGGPDEGAGGLDDGALGPDDAAGKPDDRPAEVDAASQQQVVAEFLVALAQRFGRGKREARPPAKPAAVAANGKKPKKPAEKAGAVEAAKAGDAAGNNTPDAEKPKTKPSGPNTKGKPAVAPKKDGGEKTGQKEGSTGTGSDAVRQMFEKLDALNKKADALADSVATRVDEKIDGKLAEYVEILREDADAMREKFYGLESRFKTVEKALARNARKEDVALVLFHTTRLDARIFSPVLEQIFLEDGYRTLFTNYRLALFRAADGRRWSDHVFFEQDPDKPVLRQHLNFESENSTSSEQTERLIPAEFFEGSPRDAARRMVIVASIGAQPPPLNAPEWKGVQCYVILVDETGKEREGQSEACKRWQEFCQRPGEPEGRAGEATVVSYVREKGKPLPAEAERQFLSRLRWYIRPI